VHICVLPMLISGVKENSEDVFEVDETHAFNSCVQLEEPGAGLLGAWCIAGLRPLIVLYL